MSSHRNLTLLYWMGIVLLVTLALVLTDTAEVGNVTATPTKTPTAVRAFRPTFTPTPSF